MKKIYTGSTFLTFALTILVILLSGVLGNQYLAAHQDSKEKARDAVRISDVDQIHQALTDYYNEKGIYPACLYKSVCKDAREGSTVMPTVAKDPLTGLGYSYASYGKGVKCTGFHVGTSLERSASHALLTGSDAPPQASSALCAGSSPDFSGLSYAQGGQPCNLVAGTPQPTDAADGETCYDIARHKPAPVQ